MDERLKVVPAVERIDRVTFNPVAEFTEHVVQVATYVCPWCTTAIQFNTGTLRQFEKATVSPLGSQWSRRCDSVRAIGPWEWAADFRCAGCHAGVRMIYGHDGEYAMGAWKYRVHDIVEEPPTGAG